MNTSKRLCCIAVCIAATFTFAPLVNAQFENTAKWVPDSANTIVMVRAKQIFRSEIAKKENWIKERRKAFEAGATFIPPSAERFLIASQLDFEFMEPVWQVSVLEKSGDPIDIVKVTEMVKGNIDTISGLKAVAVPNDALLVQVDDKTLVSMAPANRQLTSRWLRKSQSGTMNLSPYLTQAVKFADKNADVIVAVDFADVSSPSDLRERLEGSGVCPADDLESVCSTLSDLKGLTLGITINDNVTGAIKIDFNRTPASLNKIGKQLLIHALERNGLMIDDFADWDMQIGANQLMLGGRLSTTGLRKIGTLIEHPLTADFSDAYAGSQSEVDMKTRTLQYFNSIQDLEEELRGQKAKALETYAKWFDKYARRIDRMSILNVDPEMIDYGRYVADSYRDISGMLLDSQYSKVMARESFADQPRGGWGGYDVGYGFTRYGYWRNGADRQRSYNLRNRQRVGAQETLKGANQAKEVMREIDGKTAEVRRAMSDKYQIDF